MSPCLEIFALNFNRCRTAKVDLRSNKIDEDLWNAVSGRAAALRSFLRENPGRAAAADRARRPEEQDPDTAFAYRRLKRLREGGIVGTR